MLSKLNGPTISSVAFVPLAAPGAAGAATTGAGAAVGVPAAGAELPGNGGAGVTLVVGCRMMVELGAPRVAGAVGFTTIFDWPAALAFGAATSAAMAATADATTNNEWMVFMLKFSSTFYVNGPGQWFRWW